MSTVEFVVVGRAAPQGSKRHVGHGRLVESSKALPQWRNAVAVAAYDHRPETPFTEPVDVKLLFGFRRPRGHYRAGRYADLLRDDAPRSPAGRGTPDVDKLARGVLDALVTGGVIADDSQVVWLTAHKSWTEGVERAHIIVTTIERNTP